MTISMDPLFINIIYTSIMNIYYIIVSILIICLVLSCWDYKTPMENFNNKLIQTKKKDKGQIDMLTYSTFKKECCPSVYSNSSGCLCYDNIEDLALITRGGNRYFTENDAYIQSITRNTRNKYVNPNLS
jgi:hypothetical protein